MARGRASSIVPIRARLLFALASYHILIVLGGAVLLVYRAPIPDAVGVAAITIGILIALEIVMGSLRAVRKAAARSLARGTPAVSGAPTPRASSRCLNCGWLGRAILPTCPRCGRVIVRLAGHRPELG